LGAKQTLLVAAHMSACDPKRTFGLCAGLLRSLLAYFGIGNGLVYLDYLVPDFDD